MAQKNFALELNTIFVATTKLATSSILMRLCAHPWCHNPPSHRPKFEAQDDPSICHGFIFTHSKTKGCITFGDVIFLPWHAMVAFSLSQHLGFKKSAWTKQPQTAQTPPNAFG